MTDQTESGQVVSSGQNGQTTPPEQQGDQQTSQQAPVFTPEQQAWIQDLVKRTDQSAKDKAYKQIERKVTDNTDQLDRFAALLKQPGMTVERAKREMQIDQLLAGYDAPPASANPAPSNAGQQQAPEPVDFTAIYNAVGLESTDNDVIRLTVQHAANPDRLKSALVDLKQRRMSQPPANPATVATPSGGGVTSTNTQLDQKTAELSRLLSNPGANMKRIQELKKEIAGLS